MPSVQTRRAPTGAIEVGGSHASAQLVDAAGHVPWTAAPRERIRLDPNASAEELLRGITTAALAAGIERSARCGVAVPGPFDHESGIARYADVGKFEALAGLDVGAALRRAIPGPSFTFVNDAAAFLLGEAAAGAALGHGRAAGLTLGTGVGSAFLADGAIVTAGIGVPPDGEVHLLEIDGRPLEDTVSARAIQAAYRRTAGEGAAALDVRAIADLARAGDPVAGEAFVGALGRLGMVISSYLARFGATVLVVGGSMSGSWDLVRPALAKALTGIEIVRSADPEWAALLGAALAATVAGD
jgi:glucokinase